MSGWALENRIRELFSRLERLEEEVAALKAPQPAGVVAEPRPPFAQKRKGAA